MKQVLFIGNFVDYIEGQPRYGRPSMSQVPPVAEFLTGDALFSTLGFFTYPNDTWFHFINLITTPSCSIQVNILFWCLFKWISWKQCNCLKVTLVGTAISNWNPIGESQWVVSKAGIAFGNHSFASPNPSCQYYGLVYGYALGEGYSFVLGTRGKKIMKYSFLLIFNFTYQYFISFAF